MPKSSTENLLSEVEFIEDSLLTACEEGREWTDEEMADAEWCVEMRQQLKFPLE